MVCTVTFNPALDYVLHMSTFRPGALNRSKSEEFQCGGKGVNVSIVLHNLGIETTAWAFWRASPVRHWTRGSAGPACGRTLSGWTRAIPGST